MPIGITEEHEHLRQAVRRFVDDHIPPGGRARGRRRRRRTRRPAVLGRAAEPGWLGLHVDEAHGGAGYGLVEQAVVVEELGPRVRARARTSPTAIVAAILEDDGGPAAAGVAARSSRRASAPARSRSTAPGSVLGGARRRRDRLRGRRRRGTRSTRPTVARARAAEHRPHPPRRAARPRRRARPRRTRACPGSPTTRVRDLAAVLLAAEAVGVAQWCVDTAAEYAKVRVQFGRPIGQFQGVKHRCAEMLARVELARAAVWDAAARRRRRSTIRAPRSRSRPRPRSRSTPRSLNAKDCVQTLGGIGFTWEHDAHIYLRRAMTLHQLTGTPDDWRVRAARPTCRAARAAGSRSTSAPRGRGVPRRAARAARRRSRTSRRREQRDRLAADGLRHAGLARAVGPRREGARAARDRRGVPRREGDARRTSASARGRCRT